MPEISIIIVDDHPVVRDGLGVMLESSGMFRLVGCAADGAEAIELCRRKGPPDVVISDVRMPEMDGFEMAKRLRMQYPSIRILLLAGMPLKAEAEKARRLGANGYLPKSVNQTRLVDAIRFVVAHPGEFMEEASLDEPASLLSPREREVLEYMRIGKTREVIAQILGIGAETVRSHVKNILAKLDAENAAAAVNRAYELGILRP